MMMWLKNWIVFESKRVVGRNGEAGRSLANEQYLESELVVVGDECVVEGSVAVEV